MTRYGVTDSQRNRLAPLLPPQRPITGRPKDHRTIINGILWILRTGAPWRVLPERYGAWKTVYSRFGRWQEAGIWNRTLMGLQFEAAHGDQIDGSITMIYSSSIRSHQHAAGREKGTQQMTRDSTGAPWST